MFTRALTEDIKVIRAHMQSLESTREHNHSTLRARIDVLERDVRALETRMQRAIDDMHRALEVRVPLAADHADYQSVHLASLVSLILEYLKVRFKPHGATLSPINERIP